RRALRLGEMQQALAVLGVDRTALHPLDIPDGNVPAEGQPGFEAAASRIAALACECAARTLLAPWRRDPHPDHRAVADMARVVRDRYCAVTNIVEYAVWMDERGTSCDRPQPGEVREFTLDVSSVATLKAAAVAAHASQHGRVIVDDPGGFTLPASLVARTSCPVEKYYEPLCPGAKTMSP